MKEKTESRLKHLFTPYSSRLIIGILVIVCGFGYLFYTKAKGGDDETDVKIAVITLMTFVLGYFFGTSKDKSDIDKADTYSRVSVEEIKREADEQARP